MIEKTIISITKSGQDHWKVVFDDNTHEYLTEADIEIGLASSSDFKEGMDMQKLVGCKFNYEI